MSTDRTCAADALLPHTQVLKTTTGDKKDVAVTDAFRNKKYVAFYFSAHWCGPCRQFTPRLAAAYTKIQARDPTLLEVVFVSADREEAQYDDYRATMPFPAVPYDEETMSAISEPFGIDGFPTLVVVDNATGKVLVKDAVQDVAQDPEGTSCPWVPESLRDLLADNVPLVGSAHTTGATSIGELRAKGVKHIALYFSAHWCGPCRQFTPQLAEAYKQLVASDHAKDYEFIFVTSDRSEEEFNEYRATMGFAAVAFGHPVIGKLKKALGVRGIPSLATVDLATGNVINANARGQADKVADFPWQPKDVTEFEPSAELYALFQTKTDVPLAIFDLGNSSDDDVAKIAATLESSVKALKAEGPLNANVVFLKGDKPRKEDCCPAGCLLVENGDSGNNSCDACGENCASDAKAYSCRRHNFDMCKKCFDSNAVVLANRFKLLKRILEDSKCDYKSDGNVNLIVARGFSLGKVRVPLQATVEGNLADPAVAASFIRRAAAVA